MPISHCLSSQGGSFTVDEINMIEATRARTDVKGLFSIMFLSHEISSDLR